VHTDPSCILAGCAQDDNAFLLACDSGERGYAVGNWVVSVGGERPRPYKAGQATNSRVRGLRSEDLSYRE
jgi:hypothetical protein